MIAAGRGPPAVSRLSTGYDVIRAIRVPKNSSFASPGMRGRLQSNRSGSKNDTPDDAGLVCRFLNGLEPLARDDALSPALPWGAAEDAFSAQDTPAVSLKPQASESEYPILRSRESGFFMPESGTKAPAATTLQDTRPPPRWASPRKRRWRHGHGPRCCFPAGGRCGVSSRR